MPDPALTPRRRIQRFISDLSFIAGMAAALIILGPIYLVIGTVRQFRLFRGTPAVHLAGNPAVSALTD